MLTWPGPGVETPVCTYETHLRGLGQPRSAAAGFVSSTQGFMEIKNQETRLEGGAVPTSHHEWWACLFGEPPKGGCAPATGCGGGGPFRVLATGQSGHSWPENPGLEVPDSLSDFHQRWGRRDAERRTLF
jgi:hypothetical protein